MRKTDNGKKNRWFRILLIWITFLLLLGAGGCAALYKYLGVYEISRPEAEVEKLTEQNFSELVNLLAESLDADRYPFEDIRLLFRAYCEQNLSGKKLTYYEDKSQRMEDRAIFYVRAGGFNLCSVVVEADTASRLGFGRYQWKVEKVLATEALNSLDSVTLSVKAPDNVSVYLNGKLLTEEYLAGEAQDLPNLSKLESSFDCLPKLVTYSVHSNP